MAFLDFLSYFSFKTARHDLDVSFTIAHNAPCQDTVSVVPPCSTSVRRLPLDTIMDILDAAYFNDDLQQNTATLKACSLVCKEWSLLAQMRLFRKVSLRTQAMFNRFRQTVNTSTAKGRALSESVERLHVILDDNLSGGLSPMSFAGLVLLCPNLKEVDLAIYGSNDSLPEGQEHVSPTILFDQDVLSLLQAGPKVKFLRLHNGVKDGIAAAQILAAWPSLHNIHLIGFPPNADVPSPSFELSGVRLNFQYSPSVKFLQWLLNGPKSIQTVTFDREPSSAALLYLAQEHRDTIRSLSLPTCTRAHAPAVQKMALLKEFRIQGSWVPPLVLKKLPSGLRHLALGLGGDTPLHTITELMGEDLKNLKTISAQIRPEAGGEGYTMLPSLQEICSSNGIELRSSGDTRRFHNFKRYYET